jgi:hypothetical protein
MDSERSEAGRRLVAARWQTPERRRAKVEKLADEVRHLDDTQFEELRELLEKP